MGSGEGFTMRNLIVCTVHLCNNGTVGLNKSKIKMGRECGEIGRR